MNQKIIDAAEKAYPQKKVRDIEGEFYDANESRRDAFINALRYAEENPDVIECVKIEELTNLKEIIELKDNLLELKDGIIQNKTELIGEYKKMIDYYKSYTSTDDSIL